MKSHTQRVKTSFDHALTDGREVCIEFERVTVSSPEHYGADADGNRGIWITSIDDDRAEQVTVEFYGAGPDGRGPATRLEDLHADTRAEVDAAIEAYLDKHEPEVQEEREPDYDRINDERAGY